MPPHNLTYTGPGHFADVGWLVWLQCRQCPGDEWHRDFSDYDHPLQRVGGGHRLGGVRMVASHQAFGARCVQWSRVGAGLYHARRGIGWSDVCSGHGSRRRVYAVFGPATGSSGRWTTMTRWMRFGVHGIGGITGAAADWCLCQSLGQ